MAEMPYADFEYPYKMYSGYLKGNKEGTFKMFYWLVEAYEHPEDAPLLLWLSGGPGCSSVAGALEELGPFYVNRDGKSLFQHAYAWNRHANVLFIESPVGTGFSYNTEDPKSYTVGDDLTADINLHALSDFFSRVQPQYKTRTFFISGESYAGIYIPTLARLIVRGINDKTFPNTKFQGMMIGNGYCNVEKLANSLILFHHYHGRIGL
ncbi:unnamed protein product [Anisakis simplex]|uniref:Carboxypeptidase n=1 Tax=Anisakis simplex TaxID=6269 RepID=A0A0M3J110_ANISI|nr:unnamed protein product [Anisakis simplex]